MIKYLIIMLSKMRAFKIVKIEGDLFDVVGETSLCHCVSADLNMGAGIATQFKKRYGVAHLAKQGIKTGGVAIGESDHHFVYNLVTKDKYYDLPTLTDLQSSLTAMRDHALEHRVRGISMPRVGCGLDKLHWNDVQRVIEDLFEGTGIEIHVYKL